MKNLYKIFLIVSFLISLAAISSCSKDEDNPVNPGGTSTSMQGTWHVDQIQMVQAPTTGTLSALMKQALVPFGLVSASAVGVCNVKFGMEKWLPYNTGTNTQSKLFFLNQQTGWISENYGNNDVGIFATNNGGISWSAKKTVLSYSYIDGMSFIDENLGFVIARTNSNTHAVVKTTDNGLSWVTQSSFQSSNINRGIHFSDNLNGILLQDGLVGKTTDGGIFWVSTYSNFGSAGKLQFFDSQNGLFISRLGNLIKLNKTTDGGSNWFAVNCPDFSNFYCYHFINNSKGWISSTDNSNKSNIYKTIDGGISWIKVNSEKSFSEIMFTNESKGYGISSGKTYFTSDAGENWNIQITSNNYIRALKSFDENICYLLSDNGQFLSKSNILDTAVWSLNGKITSPAIQIITKSGEEEYYAYGYYSLLNNNIVFIVNYYSGSMGNVNTGTGTYTFGANSVSIIFDFANSEQWKIILKR